MKKHEKIIFWIIALLFFYQFLNWIYLYFIDKKYLLYFVLDFDNFLWKTFKSNYDWILPSITLLFSIFLFMYRERKNETQRKEDKKPVIKFKLISKINIEQQSLIYFKIINLGFSNAINIKINYFGNFCNWFDKTFEENHKKTILENEHIIEIPFLKVNEETNVCFNSFYKQIFFGYENPGYFEFGTRYKPYYKKIDKPPNIYLVLEYFDTLKKNQIKEYYNIEYIKGFSYSGIENDKGNLIEEVKNDNIFKIEEISKNEFENNISKIPNIKYQK